MPNRLSDWHEHIKEVEGEYRATRRAVDRLKAQLVETPEIREASHRYVNHADRNLEGTYLVRLFAAFEAALRSYDRARHNDPTRTLDAAILIDTTGGRRGQGISTAVREGAHAVRLVRNDWAHKDRAMPALMPLAEARARLQKHLAWLAQTWD